MFTDITAQENVLDMLPLHTSLVVRVFNCHEVNQDERGIFIQGPMVGHWLRDSEYEALQSYLELQARYTPYCLHIPMFSPYDRVRYRLRALGCQGDCVPECYEERRGRVLTMESQTVAAVVWDDKPDLIDYVPTLQLSEVRTVGDMVPG